MINDLLVRLLPTLCMEFGVVYFNRPLREIKQTGRASPLHYRYIFLVIILHIVPLNSAVMMMKCQSHGQWKLQYPEETTDLWQVTDETFMMI